MNQKHLFTYSLSYELLKKYVKSSHAIYYKESCIVGKEHIPSNEPVIFAPNHQNALMDALAILLTIEKQPVFMARADIFKQETVRKILNFLKIIPVYRIRDGVENMANNDESFNIALQTLRHKQPVGIMPEGNHGDQHRLRPLKKGLIRFALQAQENLGEKEHVKIVPVGLEYSHYTHFRSKLLVVFGKPIDVAEYYDTYKSNPQVAYNQLRDRLAEEMRKNMLNIDNSEYYDLIFNLKEIYSGRLQQKQALSHDYRGRFLAEKQVTEKLIALAKDDPTLLETMKIPVNEYTNGLKRLKFRDWVFDASKPDTKTLWFDLVRYLFFLPFFVTATAFNYPLYFFSKTMADKIKDPQFRSSVKFTLGTFLYPVYCLLFLILPFPILLKLFFILPMPILGIFSFDYYISLKKQWAKYRFFKLLKENNGELDGLKQLRNRIFSTLDKLFQ